MKLQRKRMVAILLTLMMVLTMIPSMAFAETEGERSVNAEDNPNAYGYEQTDTDRVTVTVTLSSDGMPLQGVDGTPLSHLEVTVPYFDLGEYGLSDYYRYETNENGGEYINTTLVKRPTALHLYIYLLERYYKGLPEEECGKGDAKSEIMSYQGPRVVKDINGEDAYNTSQYSAINITGGATSTYLEAYFGHSCNLMYYQNHKYPLMNTGWGATSDYMLLSDGDVIDIGMFTHEKFYTFGRFLAFGKQTYTAEASGVFDFTTYGTPTESVMMGAEIPPEKLGVITYADWSGTPMDGYEEKYPEITLYDSEWNLIKNFGYGDGYVDGVGKGDYVGTAPAKAGTYYLMVKDAYNGKMAVCAPGTAKLIVSGGSEPETPVDDLAQNRIDANNQLDTYVDKTKYREVQRSEIEQIITAAKETIAAAESADAITQAVASAKIAIDAIKTDEQLDKEEADAKAAAAAKNIANKTISGIKAEYTYTGKAITPAVSIAGLKAGTDFTVTYSNNINVGTATVTIKGIGNYNGTTTRTFKIVKPLPAEGAVLKDTGNKAKYEVTESERGGVEVAYTAPVNKKAASVTIPATVKLADGTVAEVTIIDAKAFKNNKKVKKVTVGQNVETIGKEAFAGATKLTTVKMGTEVENIGSKAFSGCKKLKTVSMGKNVETIGSNAFAKCTSLKSVTLPADVEKIGSKAFYGDKKLKKITIKSKKLTSSRVGKQAFKGVYSKAKVNVPNNKVKAYKKFFYKKGLSKKAKIS